MFTWFAYMHQDPYLYMQQDLHKCIKIHICTLRFVSLIINQAMYIYSHIKIRVCILRFVRIHQDPGIKWKYIYTEIWVYMLRFLYFRHKVKRHRGIDYRAFKRRPKMSANRTKRGSSSFVRREYRAMTEEVSCERSRVSGGNCSNVEEELSRNFQIPRYHSLLIYKIRQLE